MTSTREAGAQGFARVAADALVVAGGTVLSRVTGVGRALAVAAVLGPTFLGNLFQALYVLPALTYQLLVGAVFAGLLVPTLVRHVDRRDAEAQARVAGGFLTVAGLLFTVAGGLAVLAAPLLLQLFTIGVDDPAVAADQRRVGVLLLALVMPQILLLAIAGTAGAVLNAHGRFGLTAGAPAVENLAVMAVMAVTAIAFGSGTEISEVSTAQILVMGGGSSLAVALHAIVLWAAAARVGVRLLPRAGWRERDVRNILRKGLSAFGVTSVHSVPWLLVLPVANRIPGGVVALQLAGNFAALPIALVAKPVATALLPRLSRLFNEGAQRLVRDELLRGVTLVAFLALPAAVGCIVLAEPLSRVVAFGEMATPQGETAIAVAVAALAPGIVGDAVFFVEAQAFYAKGDFAFPLRSLALSSAVALVGVGIGFMLAPGLAVLLTVGLALSAGQLLSAWHLYGGVSTGLPQGVERLAPSLAWTLAASVLMAGPVYLVGTHLPLGGGRVGETASLALAVLVGAGVFLGLQALWRAPQLASLLEGVRGLRSRAAD